MQAYYADVMEEKRHPLLFPQPNHRFWTLLCWEATKTHSQGLAPFPAFVPLAKEASHTRLACRDQLSSVAQCSGLSTFSSHRSFLQDAHTCDFWQCSLMTPLLVVSREALFGLRILSQETEILFFCKPRSDLVIKSTRMP